MTLKNSAVFTAIIMIIFADVSAFSEVLNDGEEYNKLCTYDSYCQKLKNRDGTYVKPKEGLMKVMNSLNDPLREISKQLSVDSNAIAGAILAENSLNVQVDDDTHSFLEKIKLNPLANDISKFLRGKSFSVGFGQIKPESALASENLLAQIEKRPPRTQEDVTKALLNPIESLKYAAAIMRQCQDDYKKNGFDISKNPAVLVTLYNLGNCPDKAAEAKARNRLPRPNFFGFFITHFKDDISKGIGLTDDANSAAGVITASAAASLNKRLTDGIPLAGHPPKCDTDGAGAAGDYHKVATFARSGSVVTGRGEYKVLSPGIDCDLKDWSLIQTSHGETGWVANDVLDLHSESFVKASAAGGGANCDPKLSAACQDKIKRQLGTDFIGFDSNGMVEVKLTGGAKDPSHPNFKTFDAGKCFDNGGSSMGMSSSSWGSLIDAKTAQALAERVEKKKAEIIKALKLKAWDDPKNVTASAIDGLLYGMKENCKIQCRGNVGAVEAVLNADASTWAGYAGYKAFTGASNGLYFSSDNSTPAAATNGNNKTDWNAQLVKVSRECRPIFEVSPKSRKMFEAMIKQVDARGTDLPSPDVSSNEGGSDIAAVCRGLNAVKRARAKSGPDGSIDLKRDECSQCRVSMTFTLPQGSMGTSVNFGTVANYLNEDSDYDDFLSSAMASMNQQLGIATQYEDPVGCTYDPVRTSQKIEALASDACVESIFAPDYYLINRFYNRPGGAFYKPFSEDDRFAIKLKDGCSRLDSASAEPVSGKAGASK